MTATEVEQSRGTAAQRRCRRSALALALVASLVACATGPTVSALDGPIQPACALAAPVDFATRLVDDVRDLGNGRVAWSTTWCLVWTAPASGCVYDVETLTCEGACRTLRRSTAPELRVELARGENAAGEGMPTRALQLALRAGELAFRVRAVDGARAGAWSRVIEVQG